MFAGNYNHLTYISEPQGKFLGRVCCAVPEGCIACQCLPVPGCFIVGVSNEEQRVCRFFYCKVTMACEVDQGGFWGSLHILV